MLKKISAYFLGWKLFVYATALAAISYIPLGDQFYFIKATFKAKLPYLIWIWGNYDGAHYLELARRSYQSYEFGYFPLYPVLIGTIGRLFHMPFTVTAVLISNLCLFLSLIIIFKLLQIDKKTALFEMVLIAILAFPTSMFYQALYNDSLFFFLACLTLYFGRKEKWFIACLCGGLATLCRLNGLALFFFILVEYTGDTKKQWGSNLTLSQIIKSKIYSVFLIPGAFVSFLFYINIKSGSWTTLFSSMKEWNQDKITFPLQVVWRYIKIFFSASPSHFNYWIAALEFGFVLFYAALIVWSFKKIRFSYWVFFVLSILIPSLTGTFQGMPRYGLHLYPLFLTIALFFENKSKLTRMAYLLISIGLMLFYIGFFTRGYFVA